MSTFNSEIAYINRKLPTTKVQWGTLPALSQIISPPFGNPDEAKHIVNLLKDALGKRALVIFHKMVFSASSKLRGGTRVIIDVKLLRENFGGEIDSDGGGGGKGYNPMSTQPKPPGRGI